MELMFKNCKSFDLRKISDWSVDNVTNFKNMFQSSLIFLSPDLDETMS